jgi:hypothetical protein
MSRMVARDEAAMLLLREGAREKGDNHIVGDGKGGDVAADHGEQKGQA